MRLPDPERTLTLLAAGTGLRISECLGLQWQDVNFAESLIHVRRTWTCGQVGHPKSKASQAPVPLHPLLAEFLRDWKKPTLYGGPDACRGIRNRINSAINIHFSARDHSRETAEKTTWQLDSPPPHTDKLPAFTFSPPASRHP